MGLGRGTVVHGRYRIEETIGSGGFGTVYRATEIAKGREVALKVLKPDALYGTQGVKRFEREAALAQHLRHPNTVVLYDYGSDGAVHYIAYELLRGRALSDEIEQGHHFDIQRIARITTQVLKSLAEAHASGIVHRDIKPSNIFLAEYAGERDFVKVLDLGIAKDLSANEATRLTQTGHALGTPSYMSPEQLRAKGATPSSDLYAVGLVMAEMIGGTYVYAGTPLEVVAQKLLDSATPLSSRVMTHRLGPVAVRATHVDPSHRHANAREMLAHVEQLMTAHPAVAHPLAGHPAAAHPLAGHPAAAHPPAPYAQLGYPPGPALPARAGAPSRTGLVALIALACAILLGAAGALVLALRSGGEAAEDRDDDARPARSAEPAGDDAPAAAAPLASPQHGELHRRVERAGFRIVHHTAEAAGERIATDLVERAGVSVVVAIFELDSEAAAKRQISAHLADADFVGGALRDGRRVLVLQPTVRPAGARDTAAVRELALAIGGREPDVMRTGAAPAAAAPRPSPVPPPAVTGTGTVAVAPSGPRPSLRKQPNGAFCTSAAACQSAICCSGCGKCVASFEECARCVR